MPSDPNISAFTTVFRASDPHRIKRNRQPVSCTACQRRKTKCNRGQPCDACEKRGDALGCRFGPVSSNNAAGLGGASSNAGGARTRTGTSVNGVTGTPRFEAQARLSKLEEMVRSMVNGNGTVLGSSRENKSDFSPSTGKTDQARRYTNREVHGSAPRDREEEDEVHGLADDDTDARYHSATTWNAVAESLRDLQQFLDTEVDNDDASTGEYGQHNSTSSHRHSHRSRRSRSHRPKGNARSRSASRSSSGSRSSSPLNADMFFGPVNTRDLTTSSILSSLPPRGEADQLIAAYFNAKFICPIYLHAHQFRRRYEAFWSNPSAASLIWVSMLFSILSTAAMVVRSQGRSASGANILDGSAAMSEYPISCSEQHQKNWVDMSRRCLVAGDYLKPTKSFSVEAVLLHSQCRNVQLEDNHATHWSISSLAVRLAQRKGYHRDPSKIYTSNASSKPVVVTPFETEMRRRIWFQVHTFDMLFSTQAGLPPIVYEDVCDVGHPTNLTDDDFDEDSTELPPARPEIDPNPILVYVLKSRLCTLLGRIIRQTLSVHSHTHADTMKLSDDMDQWYASVPTSLRSRSIRSTAFTDPNYTIMHRVMLELMYHKSMCILHRPYLTLAKGSPESLQSREICRNAALRLVELHIEFDQEIQPGGRMYDGRYMLGSLALHDFLIAVMVLSLDLTEYPDISYEDKEHRIHTLRQAQRIWARRSFTSSEAGHASKILRAILNKVETPSLSSDADTLVVEDTTSHKGSVPSLTNATFAAKDQQFQDKQMQQQQQQQQQSTADTVFDPSQQVSASTALDVEYPVNFDEFLPIGDFFGNSEALDWASIDQYLRYDGFNSAMVDHPMPDNF